MSTRQILVCVTLFASIATGAARAQTTWYVDDDNCPGPGTGTVEDPFCTVQSAVNVAVDGDTIEVAPGEYADGVDMINRNITIVSTDGPYATKLGPAAPGPLNDSVVNIQGCDGAGVWIRGFTIRNGRGYPGLGYGGGVVIATSKVRLENNIIHQNSAWATGGGIYITQATDPLEIIDCLITDNSVPGLETWNVGGGLCSLGSDVLILGTTFANNEAGYRGGAVCITGTATLTTHESIFWGDTAWEGPEIYAWAGTDTIVLTIDYTDLDGGVEGIGGHGAVFINDGEGNIDEDPEFLDTPAYHVPPCSPVVNAGTPYLAYFNATDIDGEWRTMDGRLEMGADEVDLSLVPDCDFNDNDVLDITDVVQFASCFTGPCGDPPCDPPLYDVACCLIGDFEDDGDVDLGDAAAFQAAFGA